MELNRSHYPKASLKALESAIEHANATPAIRVIGEFRIEHANSIDTSAKQVIFWKKSGGIGKAFFWFAKDSVPMEFHRAVERIKGACLLAETTMTY